MPFPYILPPKKHRKPLWPPLILEPFSALITPITLHTLALTMFDYIFGRTAARTVFFESYYNEL